jgi:hypothetical protein
MENIISWILENKQWIFSGIGVFIISGIVAIIFRSKRKNKESEIDQTVNKGNVTVGKSDTRNVSQGVYINSDKPESKSKRKS